MWEIISLQCHRLAWVKLREVKISIWSVTFYYTKILSLSAVQSRKSWPRYVRLFLIPWAAEITLDIYMLTAESSCLLPVSMFTSSWYGKAPFAPSRETGEKGHCHIYWEYKIRMSCISLLYKASALIVLATVSRSWEKTKSSPAFLENPCTTTIVQVQYFIPRFA